MKSKRLLEIKPESSPKHPIHMEPSSKPLSKKHGNPYLQT
jgi:hypothetical protein